METGWQPTTNAKLLSKQRLTGFALKWQSCFTKFADQSTTSVINNYTPISSVVGPQSIETTQDHDTVL